MGISTHTQTLKLVSDSLLKSVSSDSLSDRIDMYSTLAEERAVRLTSADLSENLFSNSFNTDGNSRAIYFPCPSRSFLIRLTALIRTST